MQTSLWWVDGLTFTVFPKHLTKTLETDNSESERSSPLYDSQKLAYRKTD